MNLSYGFASEPMLVCCLSVVQPQTGTLGLVVLIRIME